MPFLALLRRFGKLLWRLRVLDRVRKKKWLKSKENGLVGFWGGYWGVIGVFVGWWGGSDGEVERLLEFSRGVWGFWEGDYASPPFRKSGLKMGVGKISGRVERGFLGCGWKFWDGWWWIWRWWMRWKIRFKAVFRRFKGLLWFWCGFGYLMVRKWLRSEKTGVSITFDFGLFGYLEVFWGVFGGVLGWKNKLKFGEWEKFTSGMKIRMTTHPDFFL